MSSSSDAGSSAPTQGGGGGGTGGSPSRAGAEAAGRGGSSARGGAGGAAVSGGQGGMAAAAPKSVVSIAPGSKFTCQVLVGGEVECWGSNTSGQLGNETNKSSDSPVLVKKLAGPAKQVVAGYSHACAVLEDKTVQCWGYNYAGQLGNGTETSSNVPVFAERLGGRHPARDGLEQRVCPTLGRPHRVLGQQHSWRTRQWLDPTIHIVDPVGGRRHSERARHSIQPGGACGHQRHGSRLRHHRGFQAALLGLERFRRAR